MTTKTVAPLMGLITQGYLSPIVAKGIFMEGLNLDAVRTRHGDFVEADLGFVVE